MNKYVVHAYTSWLGCCIWKRLEIVWALSVARSVGVLPSVIVIAEPVSVVWKQSDKRKYHAKLCLLFQQNIPIILKIFSLKTMNFSMTKKSSATRIHTKKCHLSCCIVTSTIALCCWSPKEQIGGKRLALKLLTTAEQQLLSLLTQPKQVRW